MSITATRAPRFTPPAAPTRKPTPRRRTLGQGASVVGRADRPVLRILAGDESDPVVTRVTPSVAGPVSPSPGGRANASVVEPADPSVVGRANPSLVEPANLSVVEPGNLPVVEPADFSVVEPADFSVVEPASAASGVETHGPGVDLHDFFVPEYDGDDVSVEIARPRPSTLRLTRRGRLVVFGASLAATLGLGLLAASGSLANDQPEQTRVVVVQPGQTLWDIAAGVSDGDVRSTIAHLEAINHLDTTTLQAGQHLRVPR